MKNLYCCIILLICFKSTSVAQDITLFFKDEKSKMPLPGVTVTISRDSVTKKMLSDQNGKIKADKLISGNYQVKTQYIGSIPLDTLMYLRNGESYNVILKEQSVSLQDVTIQGKKKFIEMKKGNFIMNVQESALAKTSNIWDALKYGPLVEARPNGTLTVENKTATVFIDGRQILLAGEELMKYLENIPASNIEKVEISSHPGARYDSSVSSVILITTTNMRVEGVRATVNASTGYGAFPRYNSGVLLNGKKGKITTMAGYNVSRSKIQNVNDIETSINTRNLPWQVDQTATNKSLSHRAYGNFGVDFNKNKLLTLYAEYAPASLDSKTEGNNGMFSPERMELRDSVWQSLNNINSRSNSFASQAVFENKWDSTRQALKLTIAYSRNKNKKIIDNDISYYGLDGQSIQNSPFVQTDLYSKTSFITISSQYIRPLLGGEWISGARYYGTTLNNRNRLLSFSDIERSNDLQYLSAVDFKYDEVNYGLFSSWEAQVKSWYFQLGLRTEVNEVFSYTESGDKAKLYHKFTPFPTLYISKQLNEKNQLAIQYRKQISRPDYSLLNPFSRFTDNTVANFVGNAKIRPSRTHGGDISWTYNTKLVVNIGAAKMKDLISSILLRNQDGYLIQQYDNFQASYIYLGTYYAMQPLKFWQLSFNARLSTIDVEPYQDLPLGDKNLNVYGSVNNDFTLPGKWKLGIGFDGTNLQSDRLYHHRGNFNVTSAISKEFLKPQLNFYLRANDIFKTSYAGDKALFLPYSDRSYNDVRTITFGLTYRFGKQTVKVRAVNKDENLEEANSRLK